MTTFQATNPRGSISDFHVASAADKAAAVAYAGGSSPLAVSSTPPTGMMDMRGNVGIRLTAYVNAENAKGAAKVYAVHRLKLPGGTTYYKMIQVCLLQFTGGTLAVGAGRVFCDSVTITQVALGTALQTLHGHDAAKAETNNEMVYVAIPDLDGAYGVLIDMSTTDADQVGGSGGASVFNVLVNLVT